jgi:hypothetical protein
MTLLCDDPSSKLNRLKSERPNPRGLFSVGASNGKNNLSEIAKGPSSFPELGPSYRFEQILLLDLHLSWSAAGPPNHSAC